MDNKTKIIGNIVGVPNPKSDWAQNDETKANFVKNRTHYSESVLLCQYTATYSGDYWDGEEELNNTFDLPNKWEYYDNIKIIVNGEQVDYYFVGEYEGNFDVISDVEVIGSYYNSEPSFVFSTLMSKGACVELYGEKVLKLDEKYIPDSIARTEYVSELISEAIGEALEGDY